MIAYELPLGLGILGVVLATGSLRLDAIIRQQAQSGLWNVFTQPLGLLVFGVAAFAEAARLPFDLPEAEQELVGGYHTEYLGIKLMMYLVAEYIHMITAAFLIVILFLGGWHFWGLTGSGETVTWMAAAWRVLVLLVKVLAVIFFFMLSPLELAAIPLRPVDGAGLARDLAAGDGQPGGGGLLAGVRPASRRKKCTGRRALRRSPSAGPCCWPPGWRRRC